MEFSFGFSWFCCKCEMQWVFYWTLLYESNGSVWPLVGRSHTSSFWENWFWKSRLIWINSCFLQLFDDRELETLIKLNRFKANPPLQGLIFRFWPWWKISKLWFLRKNVRIWRYIIMITLCGNFGLSRFWRKAQNHLFFEVLFYKCEVSDWDLDERSKPCIFAEERVATYRKFSNNCAFWYSSIWVSQNDTF